MHFYVCRWRRKLFSAAPGVEMFRARRLRVLQGERKRAAFILAQTSLVFSEHDHVFKRCSSRISVNDTVELSSHQVYEGFRGGCGSARCLNFVVFRCTQVGVVFNFSLVYRSPTPKPLRAFRFFCAFFTLDSSTPTIDIHVYFRNTRHGVGLRTIFLLRGSEPNCIGFKSPLANTSIERRVEVKHRLQHLLLMTSAEALWMIWAGRRSVAIQELIGTYKPVFVS